MADLKARIGLPLSETLKPVQNASTNPVSASPSSSPVPTISKPRVPAAPQDYVVQKGDSLYAISRKFYGDSSHIDRIYQAKRGVMQLSLIHINEPTRRYAIWVGGVFV